MSLSEKIKNDFKRGYDLAIEIDELTNIYGRENFVQGNVDDKDKERFEKITSELRVMKGTVPSRTSFYMALGFLEYRIKKNEKTSFSKGDY
jgi:hypothetical protein